MTEQIERAYIADSKLLYPGAPGKEVSTDMDTATRNSARDTTEGLEHFAGSLASVANTINVLELQAASGDALAAVYLERSRRALRYIADTAGVVSGPAPQADLETFADAPLLDREAVGASQRASLGAPTRPITGPEAKIMEVSRSSLAALRNKDKSDRLTGEANK
jgi:hypothetical protein